MSLNSCSPFASKADPPLAFLYISFTFVGDHPSLDVLWFGTGPNDSALRLTSFLTIFGCQDFSELYGAIEVSLLAALCLVTYIVLEVMYFSSSIFDSFQSEERSII